MSGFDETYRRLRSELAATPGKRVLLVEGQGDVDFLTFMLDKPPLADWDVHARWVIGAAGGKDSVLKLLERQPRWLGLVDRDAWGETEIQAALKKTPNLRLLPRYCIENFLIDPVVFDVFAQRTDRPAAKQALTQAQAEVAKQWPQGIRHGSLWRAVQPLQDALQALGFNGALLRFNLPDDAGVQKTLADWSALLDERRVFGQYQVFQTQAAALPPETAQRVWVHGKIFWRHIVAPALGMALGEENEARLRRLAYRHLPLPDDMQTLLKTLFAPPEAT